MNIAVPFLMTLVRTKNKPQEQPKPVSQRLGCMNRDMPNTTPGPQFAHVRAADTHHEMASIIEKLMMETRPHLGREGSTEAEKIIQYACWDEYVGGNPGFAITLQRVRRGEVTPTQAAAEVNKCIDILNAIL